MTHTLDDVIELANAFGFARVSDMPAAELDALTDDVRRLAEQRMSSSSRAAHYLCQHLGGAQYLPAYVGYLMARDARKAVA